ncbi:MAG TPA: EscU/YscU/HrcU family type III secretion system export apparatus switch protein [Ilumatobacter sp.]|nr:EscU/YscU/HrcU family type III secretion system export apparatus switch protein [Ilumatobacter sp.]
MAGKSGGDKTEEATPKRKRESRRKGQVARSADLTSWGTVLVGLYLLPATIGRVGAATADAFVRIGEFADDPNGERAPRFLGSVLLDGFVAIAPLVFAAVVSVVVLSVSQTGLLLTAKPLVPDFKRINPIKGFKRLFSIRSAWETVKQVLKVVIVTAIAWPRMRGLFEALVGRGRLGLHDALPLVGSAMLGLTRAIAATVVVLAVADYGYQRYQNRRDMRMSKQEVRDEHRQQEGDGMIKGRIRSMQRALSRNRMLGEIGNADVVVTNPTHIAVALRYDPARGGAPTVVAVGAGAVAARIRERAMAASVPMVEAKPLARALWRVCDVGDPIPIALYDAVAKVLAFVRRLDRTMVSKRPMELPKTSQVDPTSLEAIHRKNRRRL